MEKSLTDLNVMFLSFYFSREQFVYVLFFGLVIAVYHKLSEG